MQAATFGRRVADRILVRPTWQRVCSEVSYVSDPEPSLHDTFGGHHYAHTLATILYQGLWLQRSVAEKLPLARTLADELTVYAELANNQYEEAPRERVAAAFLLWPYHSARYYGYTKTPKGERLKSRQALCDIQAILYNNVRTFLDILRLWFDRFDDAKLQRFVCNPVKRSEWRHSNLTQHVPDLCAVDFLVEHLLEVMKARPLVRRAIEGIQSLSVGHPVGDPHATVLQAFEALRVSQMTVFYHPNPIDVKEADELPLYELVHRMQDTDSPAEKLIPFGNDAVLAKNFRKLANTIYTVNDENAFPHFLSHRRSTIQKISETTRFISDGAISHYFLTTKPPVALSTSGGPTSNGDAELKTLWPLWYRHALTDLDPEAQLPDWSDKFWWVTIGRDELKQALFPGPQTEGTDLHKNDHLSSYWDELAWRKGRFLDRIEIPEKHPRGEPSFGYLMELLLRREWETRTSFFFALAQTYDAEKPRLCQFVGGTFLGLERPGIPFSPARFEALAARVRGLVMAVAHFSTTQALKRSRWEAKQKRITFNKGVDTISELLKGEGQYDRAGHLLFASPDAANPRETDHDYTPSTGVGWKPSRHQLKSIFVTASHLTEMDVSSVIVGTDCTDTWKSLFYLGGTANSHNTLSRFLVNWPAYQAQGGNRPSDMADRAIVCPGCFRAALRFVLSPEIYEPLAEKIKISDDAIRLPSRPGIRFLLALGRFIVDIQSKASTENTSIERIKFKRDSVVIDFNKPKLLTELENRRIHGAPNLVHTTGIFLALERCQIIDTTETDGWDGFLKSPEFARPLSLVSEENLQRLTIGWKT
jgi:hypothetical protein